MTRAFVLGNGRSRLNVNLKKLKKQGKVYGCNALYREFNPNVLIAVDPKMIAEICDSKWQISNEVWTNPNVRFKDFTNLNYFKSPRGWSSGPTALLKCCMDLNTEIFILGFDYYGIGDLFNNVYADTRNYKRSDEVSTYFGNWMKQTETIFREYPRINFYRVVDPNTRVIRDWDGINNVKHISYDEFYAMIKGS